MKYYGSLGPIFVEGPWCIEKLPTWQAEGAVSLLLISPRQSNTQLTYSLHLHLPTYRVLKSNWIFIPNLTNILIQGVSNLSELIRWITNSKLSHPYFAQRSAYERTCQGSRWLYNDDDQLLVPIREGKQNTAHTIYLVASHEALYVLRWS